jgi:hypothetical protein
VRVLAGRRVEHEQYRMRRLRIDLLEDADDLLQFRHQIGLVVQPPGRVDQQDVAALGARLFESLESEPGRIGPGRPGDDTTAGPFPPDLQLLDPGGAERIASREHHIVPGVAVLLGELGDGRRLAAAIGAEEAVDGAALNFHRQVTHNGAAAESLGQAVHIDDDIGGAVHLGRSGKRTSTG